MTVAPPPAEPGLRAPLVHPAFRNMWLASLASNLGLMVHGVGAAWAMTELTGNATLVALVQTAITLPIMLFALPAGAISDNYPRRNVLIAAMLMSFTGIGGLFALGLADTLTPFLLLAFTGVVGCGMAFFWPAWQSSVREQVPSGLLVPAVALNSMSYNIARSVGPAIGGFVVAASGAIAAFAAAALLHLPMLAVLLRAEGRVSRGRLPPEPIGRAVISGVRYVLHSPPIRGIVLRTLMFGFTGSALAALMPLVSRDMLDSGASLYGVMLAAFGGGAVAGVFAGRMLRAHITFEDTLRISLLLVAVSIGLTSVSRSPALTVLAVALGGAGWMLAVNMFNVGVQLMAPQWVAGRALALFQASLAGGVALGSLFWGKTADLFSVQIALVASAASVLLGGLAGLALRMPDMTAPDQHDEDEPPDPEVRLHIDGTSGPVTITVDYRVPVGEIRVFYRLMREVQAIRQRNGAFGLSLARNLSDPEMWVERFHFDTWHDYLRHRGRQTRRERVLTLKSHAYLAGDPSVAVRRLLERPRGQRRSEPMLDTGSPI